VVSKTNPYVSILGFLDRNLYPFFQLAEWTPFQAHYFSENPVVPGIEPSTSGTLARSFEHLTTEEIGTNFANKRRSLGRYNFLED
jgi:hypothetical protein